jgi:cell division protein FtsL
MKNQSNSLKNKKPSVPPAAKASVKPSGFAMVLHQLLNGDFFTKGNLAAKVFFILFLVILGLAYIGNTYIAENKMRELAKLEKTNRELNTEYSRIKAKLNQMKSASFLSKELESYGIRPSVEPPEKIIINP